MGMWIGEWNIGEREKGDEGINRDKINNWYLYFDQSLSLVLIILI